MDKTQNRKNSPRAAGNVNLDSSDNLSAVQELEITPLLHAQGALFNIEATRVADMKRRAADAALAQGLETPANVPVMSGTVRDENGTAISVSLFVEAAQSSGELYASLALGGRGRTKYYGKLFSRGEGDGPDHSGFIVVLPVRAGDGEAYEESDWEGAARLQVCGWRRRNANGGARLQLAISPRLVGAGELAF